MSPPNLQSIRSQPLLAALLTASLLTMGMPGIGLWPLLFVGLVPLLFFCLYQSPLRAALAGFLAGFLFHTCLLYWVVIVLGRYGGLPVWLSVPALLLLAAYMSCYCSLFAMLLSWLAGRYWHRERSVATLVWTAPVLWTGLDYLRGVFLTGFPWMDLGYGLFNQPQLIQAADLGGHHLITFSLVLANGFVVGVIDRQQREVRLNLRAERVLLLAACSFLVFVGGYSGLRYKVMGAVAARSMRAQVAVVQGNIDQSDKWDVDKKQDTVSKYLTLSQSVLYDRTTELIVWPETALPFYPQRNPLSSLLFDFTSRENTWILTGAPFYEDRGVDNGGKPLRDYYNAATLITPGGGLGKRYGKQHLVPFGEYVPLRRFLFFLSPLVENIGDFSPGGSSAPLELGTMKLGILICYESIFPDIARESVVAGANLLVNLTNDAWYGRSSAPYQSMAMAVFRAVETKRSLIRSANTGISGFVDPVGNIISKTDLFEDAALAAQVPMLEKRTLFSRSGYLFGTACFCLIPPLVLFRRR